MILDGASKHFTHIGWEGSDAFLSVTSSIGRSAGAALQLGSATEDEVRGELACRADLCTTPGVMHGGALMSTLARRDWRAVENGHNRLVSAFRLR